MGVLKKRTFDCINVDIDKDSNVCQESVTFIIPYLQRAYKWKEKQAKQMLEDFSEFLKQEKTYYCMQPLAVVKIGDNKYELLDGQQRLTTLLILWRILFESDEKTSYPYKFEYERDSSESNTLINRYSFITESDEIKKGEYGNIDEYYMSKVYGAIKLYFDNPNNKKTDEQKADNYKETFKKLLKGEGKHILFLWYEVNEEEKHTTFAHLNSGKISPNVIKDIHMKTIDGYDVKIFTDNIEDTAIEQIRQLLSIDVFSDCKIRIMPDVHAGAGCVIGFTGNLGDKVIPNIVGVDIGCGMLVQPFICNNPIDFHALNEYILRAIPSGRDFRDENYLPLSQKYSDIYQNAKQLILQLRCYRELKEVRRLYKSIGSLGSGNHFIELDKDESDLYYLVVHTGSRNLGKQVADIYQKLAVKCQSGWDKLMVEKNRIIEEYKQAGRKSELQDVIRNLHNSFKTCKLTIPQDLCYLQG